jgi:hypothetical protein
MHLISDALKASGTQLLMQSKYVGTKWGHIKGFFVPLLFGPPDAFNASKIRGVGHCPQ